MTTRTVPAQRQHTDAPATQPATDAPQHCQACDTPLAADEVRGTPAGCFTVLCETDADEHEATCRTCQVEEMRTEDRR